MSSLRDCLGKTVGKLVTREDADQLARDAYALEARGLTPVEAERQAVRNALDQATRNGEEVLRQIQLQRPQAYQQALNFWEKETIRKAGMVPPPLPRFITEPRAPAEPAAAPPAEPTRAPEAAPEPAVAATPEQIDNVTPPISDAAQTIVDSLPKEQRAAAQKAFARDDRDPLADDRRNKGLPVPKRKTAAIAPEKNTKLIAELSKYDFGKSVAETLQAFANDPKLPRWIRLITDLLSQLGLGENVSIRAVNSPNASWAALYVRNKETGKSEVLVNLADANGPGLPRIVLHELVHHGTLTKLTGDETDLTAAELTAKRELEKIFDYVKTNKEVLGPEVTRYGAATALQEFVSEIFANPKLRAKLNSTRPDGKVSLLQRFTDAVMNLLLGDRAALMRPGSMLESAIRQAINVAGSPSVETSPETIAAMHERNSRAARDANEHPNFQEEIANLVAPMADNMGISEADQIERELDHDAAFYSDTERAAIEKDVDAMAKGIDATKAEIKDVKGRLEAYIKYYRAKHPAKAGWANSEIKPLGLDPKKGLTRGKVTKANPSGINFKVKFAKTPYTFARDTANKLISRFLDRKGTVPNPEWAKRRQELGDKMFDDLQGIMARRGEGGEKGRVAQVILDQINWYRDMAAHLRVTFGSMSDYVADIIAGFSPITDVPGNWANMVDYFEGVMKGHYDDLYRKFDAYISEDPENRTASTWRDAGGELPLKLKNKAKFGTNGPNAMMAGLDLWRAVQTGTAPKARNFGLNLIGQSLKATIDRWAGRYLQRMHAPTWRLPPMIEGDVKGEHMPGENVGLVSGDFGMGQDVFEDVATRLQASGIPEFKNVTAADLQAILWFAEKEIWEMRKWTQIMGAGSSMNALAEATAAQRYEAGTMPGKVSAKDKRLMGETIGLRDKINGEQHVLGAKMVPSTNIHDGVEGKTFDGEWITHPEYDPANTVGHVAEAAARLGKDAAHISRVIVNPYEVNENRTPGLHIFFRGRVGEAEIKGVLAKLKEAGITNGISLSVDPRVRPEIIKSLDPATGANQYNGVRVQYIPEYEAADGMTRDQIEQAFADAKVALDEDANVAESRVLYYDTLVLKKDTDYDSSGKLTKNVSDGRGKAWAERARREGSEAATRRDNARKAIDDRKRQDRELELRIEREEQERIARYEEFRRGIQPPDRANAGGVDPPLVAAMQYEDEQEPVRDPHGGRASLVRAMVDRIRGGSRDREGIEVPQSQQEIRDPAGAGRGANPGRKGSAPLWGTLGGTFRKREADLYGRVESAAKLIASANPEDPGNPRDPARYENSQKLFDYLVGKETPADFELKAQIAELRKEIPVIPGKNIPGDHLDSGIEADVFHDQNSGVVHKLYSINNGGIGKKGAYVPGQLSLGADREIRISRGAKPTLSDFLGRMERSNSHGALTPHELSGITEDGRLVFTSPFVEGRGVTQKNMRGALARAGVHFLTEMGGTSGVAKLPDGRWVLYDDLHPGNVRTMPGGRVEIVDANNRELDPHEVADLTQLEKMPPEKPLGVPREGRRVQYDVVAPMAEAIKTEVADYTNKDSVKRVESLVLELASKFNLQGIVDGLDFRPREREAAAEAFGSYEGTPERRTIRSNLAFNSYVFRFKPEEIDQVFDEWSKTTGTIAGGLKGTVTHEFAHVIHNALRFNRDDVTLERMWSELKDLEKQIGHPSEYAKKSTTEWFAEQFTKEELEGKGGPLTDWVNRELQLAIPSRVEPVTVAPMAEEDVKDEADLSVAPMAGRGSRARWPWPWQERPEKVAGYKPGGMWSPQAQLSRAVGYTMQEQKAEKGAIAARAKYLAQGLEKAVRQAYGKNPTPVQLKDVQIALGNIDNRLDQAQYNQALKIRNTKTREAFIQSMHMNNVAAFKARQQAVRASLPDTILNAVDEMRGALDEQTQELLRDPGLDADLKARINTEGNVFLHSASYQHFENDVWGKYISKSNDPEAVRIRRAAENLFKNEIIAEVAQVYQADQKALGNTVTDADALAYAKASGNLDEKVKNRLGAYLRKDADEITRVHLLTGRMLSGARSEGGKMLSLRRESIPKEVRELWGQWDEPRANFVKTFSLLAQHNAENRMQSKVMIEGTAQGYIWKGTGDPPPDLVPLWKPGDHGPLKDAYGPKALKDGMANYNHPVVRQLMSDLNRFALMAKTIGSIGSAIHNLLGNIPFTIASGNLPWAVVYMPKGVFVTLMKGLEGVVPITPGKALRDEHVELIRLGVFDSDVVFGEMQEIYGATEVAAELEKRIGTGGAIHGALKMLQKAAAPVTVTAKWTGHAFKNFYVAQDNFFKYINYRTELAKQIAFNKGNPTPPSLEEMKQIAAYRVGDILPSRERVAEGVRRSVGSESLLGQFTAPFFTFPMEAGRTVANNVYHAGREMFSPQSTPLERGFGAWRVAGMLAALGLPWAVSALAKVMNHYSDDDEEALRASLPEWQRNSSFLIMLPRGENGAPGYIDLSWLNPYGYYHSALVAAGRALKSSGPAAAGGKLVETALTPLYTVQPGIGSLMDIVRNSDSLRGGAPIRNPEDTWPNQAMAMAGRAVRGFVPGTAQSLYRNYLASQGHIDPKSGRPVEVQRELESLVGAPHVETLETDKAMQAAVGNYKKRISNATQLLNDKIRAKGTVAPGEITAAYQQANEKAFQILVEMNKAYENLQQLGMSKREAIKAMQIGWGTEMIKGGLGKDTIINVTKGKFTPIEISAPAEAELRKNFPDRWREYRDVLRAAEKRYIE